VVAAETAAEAIRQLKFAAGPRGRLRTLELRLDFLRGPAERTALLDWVSRYYGRDANGRTPSSAPKAKTRRKETHRTEAGSLSLPVLIATCRTRKGGGKFSGSISAELAILSQAARAGCAWCDVEIETASQIAPAELRRAVAPARLLVSAHDFRRLPPDLPGLVKRLDRFGARGIKIAAMCRGLGDAERLLRLAHGRSDVVAIPMGERALGTRILALREGSALAYASIITSTAPGQLSLDAMHNVYRIGGRMDGRPDRRPNRRMDRRFGASANGPTRRTKIYGVIGNPVAHSLSPLMQNAAFAEQGVNALYLPFEVRDLGDFVRAAPLLGIAGFSVTIPHKQAILRYLHGCDPLAAEIGAVNTVVLRGARLYGYNTDYVGVLQAIESRVPLRSSRVLLVGAGGAARAAAFAIARKGAAVFIWARRPEQAKALAKAAGAEAVDRPALRRESFDAIVNCTPVGLHAAGGFLIGTRPGSSLGSPLQASELNCRVVMEMIYRPRVTPLLRLAAGRGIATISGVEMFIAQGAAQYEIWTGKRAPEAVMRKAVLTALKQEEKASTGR
jgi:3-dehydroquinate dehydratase / shikimate dehydrogenase